MVGPGNDTQLPGEEGECYTVLHMWKIKEGLVLSYGIEIYNSS